MRVELLKERQFCHPQRLASVAVIDAVLRIGIVGHPWWPPPDRRIGQQRIDLPLLRFLCEMAVVGFAP